ncbi:MAG: RNA polymerase sigma factor [Flavobacteriales bacterium]|nr:RNA polymerase sigma factor [Flavobacteriales bacterium]MCB9449289.1 RNA polymerase sigma factor [Flavobacteriales bacterium]
MKPHPALTDEALINGIIQGENKDLFSEIYRRYREKVSDKCFGMTHNRSIAEDLTQDIFVKTMEKLTGFRNQSQFSTWLYAITYNHCIEYLRKTKRIRFDDWESALDIPDEVEDVDVKMVLELAEERLTLLLEMLKPEDKAIIVMKFHENMSVKSIQEILHLATDSAAKMKINRAKKRLVALYQKFYPALKES